MASRPAIAIVLRAGDHFVPPRRGSAFVAGAEFGPADSGSSAAAPIVYAAEHVCHYMIQPLVELYGGCMVVLKVS